MNRIDRLMAMITRLQAPRYTTVGQLAARFAISERTVFRDLRALTEMGIPLRHEPEKGYRVGEGFFLPPVSLSTDEVHALALAEPLILRFADRSVQAHYAATLAKLEAVMSSRQQEELSLARTQAAHFVPDQYAHLLPTTEYLTPLQEAITKQQVVQINYCNLQEEVTERLLEPIGLTFYSLNWHLIAWCQLRQAYRDFRVSRIKSLHHTLRPFSQTDHLTLGEYLQRKQRQVAENDPNPLT